MKKTSIYLEPALDEALAKRAAEDGITKAEFIRRGLASLVSTPKRPKPSIGVIDTKGASPDVPAYLSRTGFGRR